MSMTHFFLRLLFPKDHRMYEVWRLLQSQRPVKVDLVRQIGVGLDWNDFVDALNYQN